MARPSQIVGLVPVGFLAVAIAAAVATVLGGWTAESSAGHGRYGIEPTVAAAPPIATGLQNSGTH